VRIRDDAPRQSDLRYGRSIKCIDAALRKPPEYVAVRICLYRVQYFARKARTKALGGGLNAVGNKAEDREIVSLLTQ
jgi:hypothetical protein